MPTDSAKAAGAHLETHRGFAPRILFFNFVVGALLLVLAGGLAYRQLFQSDDYSERAKVQNQRRIIIPGPRGNIYDREGRLLVGNRPRFALALYLDELRGEFRREYLRVRKNYRDAGDRDLPTSAELERIARHSVVQRYLDVVNRALGSVRKVDDRSLNRHYSQQRLLPYLLIEDLTPEEYARLTEQLPVVSPLQLYSSSIRHYPYGAAAAHALGYVAGDDDVEVNASFPGAELTTFKMRGTVGRNGLEARLDETLQGKAGGSIHLVDPAGYRVEPALERRLPVQGKDVVTSIDIDLQRAAEKAMADIGLAGAAVAIDTVTGEVLALASKPDFDLNAFSPRLSSAVAAKITADGGWLNRAAQGLYPPGSTFKILTAIAGLRSGAIRPDSSVECTGAYRVGGRIFVCNNHRDRGQITLVHAIEKSCNTFFYDHGLKTGVDALAAEARRFGLDQPTGIELPHEATRMLVPDPAWKRDRRADAWYAGDTANMAIGQGDLALTPLQMACFVASVARNETRTIPTLLHDPARPPQHSGPIGLSPAARAALMQGMEAVTLTGTGRLLSTPFMKVEGLRIAGKTGTAQKRTTQGTINFAWFIGFAPIDRPRIAIAVMMEGDTPGEDTGGGRYAAPIAGAILKAWDAKQHAAPFATAPATP